MSYTGVVVSVPPAGGYPPGSVVPKSVEAVAAETPPAPDVPPPAPVVPPGMTPTAAGMVPPPPPDGCPGVNAVGWRCTGLKGHVGDCNTVPAAASSAPVVAGLVGDTGRVPAVMFVAPAPSPELPSVPPAPAPPSPEYPREGCCIGSLSPFYGAGSVMAVKCTPPTGCGRVWVRNTAGAFVRAS